MSLMTQSMIYYLRFVADKLDRVWACCPVGANYYVSYFLSIYCNCQWWLILRSTWKLEQRWSLMLTNSTWVNRVRALSRCCLQLCEFFEHFSSLFNCQWWWSTWISLPSNLTWFNRVCVVQLLPTIMWVFSITIDGILLNWYIYFELSCRQTRHGSIERKSPIQLIKTIDPHLQSTIEAYLVNDV